MRIAAFHNLPAGGAKRHTFEVVRELASRGHKIHEFTQSTANLAYLPLSQFVAETTVYTLPWHKLTHMPIPGLGPTAHLIQNFRNLSRVEAQSKLIAAEIDRGGFDIAYVTDCMFTVAPFVLKYLATPSVFYAHSMPFHGSGKTTGGTSRGGVLRFTVQASRLPAQIHDSMVRQIASDNLRHARRVLTNSYFLRELKLFADGVEANVVYPGVDSITFRPRSAGKPPEHVLSVGPLVASKGHLFVIDALGLLPASIRPALVIASAVDHAEQVQQIREHAAQNGVRLTLHAAHNPGEMANLYTSALLVAFAPVLEPFGLTALEAMACGIPVVAVKEGGPREIIQDGVTGYLTNRDAKEFANALRSLIEDSALRERLGKQGRAQVENLWTWQRAGDNIEAQFAAVCSAN